MHSLLINPYHQGIKFSNFPELEQKISSYYDRIYDTVLDFHLTPRYFYEIGLKICFRDMFYYIDKLYDNRPGSVIDVGCGECIWKRWFPNITGFDPNTNEFSQQDFVDFFDKDFSAGHKENWQNGMALNSIHFISWRDIEQQIDLAMNIVRDRFLFTFNFNVMTDVPGVALEQNVAEFHSRLTQLPYKIVLFDCPALRGIDSEKVSRWAPINGTVRFILEK